MWLTVPVEQLLYITVVFSCGGSHRLFPYLDSRQTVLKLSTLIFWSETVNFWRTMRCALSAEVLKDRFSTLVEGLASETSPSGCATIPAVWFETLNSVSTTWYPFWTALQVQKYRKFMFLQPLPMMHRLLRFLRSTYPE